MHIVKKILLYLFSIILLISVLVTVLTYVFEDDIKKYAVDQLNKNLTVPVSVDQIEFSFWDRFPNASLEFSNVYIPGAYPDGVADDTMFFARRLYMEFDVVDLIKGNYVVDHMGAATGVIKVRIDSRGNGNYNIWKSSDDDSTDDDFSFKLSHVALHDYEFLYDNRSTDQRYSIGIDDAVLRGEFYKEIYDIKGSLAMHVHGIQEKRTTVLANVRSRADVELLVDNARNTYTIRNGRLSIEDMNFKVGGYVAVNDQTECDIRVEGDKIKLSSLFTNFGQTVGDFSYYSSTGEINFDAHISGEIKAAYTPMISASFSYKNGKVREPQSGVELSRVHLKGSYTNKNADNTEELFFESFEGTLPDGHIAGSFRMSDFADPLIEARLDGNLNLATAQNFLRLESVSRISGEMTLQTDIKLKVKNPGDFESGNIRIFKSEGSCSVSHVDLRLKDSELLFTDMNGSCELKGHDAKINTLTTTIGHSDISVSGSLENILPYILLDETMKIVATVQSDKVVLEDLIGSSETTESHSSGGFGLPDDIDFDLKMKLNDLTFAYFEAKHVSGDLTLHNRILKSDNIRLETAGGTLNGKMRLDGRSEKSIKLTADAEIKHMEVQKLFAQFEDFGQSVIRSENVKGLMSAAVELDCELTPGLDVIPASVVAFADVNLSKGELINLPVMSEITGYMRANRAANTLFARHINDMESRLKHIRFSEMHNQLTIKDSRVTFPGMEIRSSALNMNIQGMHTFDNHIDYAFDFRFRDLKVDESDSEFGRIIDDGTGIQLFLRMFGTVDNPQFELNREARKEDRRQDIETEKQQAKAILQKNLGLFKKDTTLNLKERPEEKVEFILYDESDGNADAEKIEKTRNRKNNKNRVGKFYEKLVKDKEPEEPVKIEIDPD